VFTITIAVPQLVRSVIVKTSLLGLLTADAADDAVTSWAAMPHQSALSSTSSSSITVSLVAGSVTDVDCKQASTSASTTYDSATWLTDSECLWEQIEACENDADTSSTAVSRCSRRCCCTSITISSHVRLYRLTHWQCRQESFICCCCCCCFVNEGESQTW